MIKVPGCFSGTQCVTLLILLFCQLGFSKPVEGFYAGTFLGLADASLDGYSFKLSYGVRGGAKLGPQFTSGIFYQQYTNKYSGTEITLAPLVIEMAYHLVTAGDGPYLGLMAGTVRATNDNVTTGYTINAENEFTVGWMAGWNLPLVPELSLGTELGYLSLSKPESFYILSLLATINYWF